MNDNYEYVKNLVQTNLNDHDYYICNQIINQNNSSYNNIYDIYCAFGNDLKFNHYQVSNIEKLCKIDTNTSYYNSSILERVVCTNTSTHSMNNYDYIYTNLSNTYPSIISEYQLIKDNNLTYNVNFMYLIPFSILLLFLALFWFKKRC